MPELSEQPAHAGTHAGTRFGFGENWRRFSKGLAQDQIEAARRSVAEMLGTASLQGRSFLDVGSGSGLFSLAAVSLGANRVHSFDYDPESVATTAELRQRFAPNANWTVEQASALDTEYMESLRSWDIVYSWGVLHHTGAMWTAFANTADRVAMGGRLFVSIYNDQGWRSSLWGRIKRVYNALPHGLRAPYAVLVMLPVELKMLAVRALRGQPQEYFRLWRDKGDSGMDRWHDLLDWAGGYPFEVATPQQVVDFCSRRGFELHSLATVGRSHGCNQFVFARPPAAGRE